MRKTTPMHIEEVVLPTGHRVKFFGFIHGTDEEKPLKPKIRKTMLKEIGDSKVLFTERKRQNFLPEELITRARVLFEPETEQELWYMIKPSLEENRRGAVKFSKEMTQYLQEMPTTINSENSEEQDRLLRKKFSELSKKRVPKEYAKHYHRRMYGLKTYMIVKRIQEHMEENPAPHEIRIVCGIAHTLQAAQFLKKPELLERYGRTLKYYLGLPDLDFLKEHAKYFPEKGKLRMPPESERVIWMSWVPKEILKGNLRFKPKGKKSK